MKEKIQEILSASENIMLPGELKAFRRQYTQSGFSVDVLRQQVDQVEGAYNKFMCLVVALCCMVPQDKEDEINDLRAEIEKTNRPTTYGGVVMCLKELIAERDLLQVFFDAERAKNESNAQTLDRTRLSLDRERHDNDRLEAENSALHRTQLSHSEQNEQAYSEEELQEIRALWGQAIKSEALREEVIFRLSQCKGVPEAMEEVMKPLFRNRKADFKKITNVDIATWLLKTLRLKKLPTHGHLKRALGTVRPAKKK